MSTATPFSKSRFMKPQYRVVSSLELRRLFRQYEFIKIVASKYRHAIVSFVIDKEQFFPQTELQADIYDYSYVIEEQIRIVRIHAVERNQKTL